MALIKVITSSDEGIHLSIDGTEYGFNKTTGVFKRKNPTTGKFEPIEPNSFVRTVCQDRLKRAIENTERHRAAMAFYDKNPNYVPMRDRHANGGRRYACR